MPEGSFLNWGIWNDLGRETNLAPSAVANVASHDVVVARTGMDGPASLADARSWLFRVGVEGYINMASGPVPALAWNEITPSSGEAITTDTAVAAASPIYAYPDGSKSQQIFFFAKNDSTKTIWVIIAGESFSSPA